MKKALFFDIGDTIIKYYTSSQWPDLFKASFKNVFNYLKPTLPLSEEQYFSNISRENHEDKSTFLVRQMETRLINSFELSNSSINIYKLCDLFMEPLLATSKIYEDTYESLNDLTKSFKLIAISNLPFGSPRHYFQNELSKYNISQFFCDQVYCRDVGYRKPHKLVFQFALHKNHLSKDEVVMIGDRLDWDIKGAEENGIQAILMDRTRTNISYQNRIENLAELKTKLK
jgi:putative hydrolase of the HAD superfamily